MGNSNHIMFGGGNSGVALNGAGSYIDLAGGPIKGSNTAIAARGNGGILKATDMGLPLPIDVAQVWKASATQGTSKFVINSVRQITTLSFAPQFGGLVIGQVANTSGVPLAVGSGVYFGEWAPRAAGTPPSNSTNLNMGSSDRTVWYVGDNPTTTMPTLANATYNVIGIQGVGTASDNLPTAPKLYGGTLTANYVSGGGSSNTLAGSITNGSNTVSFTPWYRPSNRTVRSVTALVGIPARSKASSTTMPTHWLAFMQVAGFRPASSVAFGGSRSN